MMKKFSFLFLLLLFLSSCEKETYVDYYIDNQSSSVVTVDGKNIITSNSINKMINPNDKMNIAGWSKLGKQTDFFEPTSMFGNDLVVVNSIGDTLLKDYKLLSNWISDLNDQRAVASHEYILLITDADF